MGNVIKPVRVRKRGKVFQLNYYSPDGRRRRLSVGEDRLHAERMKNLFQEWLYQGKDPEEELKLSEKAGSDKIETFREFFPVFMERHGSDQSKATQRVYNLFFSNISRCNAIADVPLNTISKAAVIRYRKERMNQDEVKPATANRETAFIRNILNRAVEYDIIQHNPLNSLKNLKEDNRREVTNITPETIKQLMGELPSSVADIVEFAVYTAFRKENVLSLTVDQVEFSTDKKSAKIRHIAKGNKYRVVQVGTKAVKVLKRAIGQRKTGYIFLNPDSKTRYTCIHKSFDRAVRKLKINIATGKKLCFHDLRRVCATWLLQKGRSLDEVREVLGHSDWATTDLYATMKVSGDVYDSVPSLD